MLIIDFGLAEFYVFDKAMSPKVCSRYFKAPELLLSADYYNYSIDIWSVGIIFASIVGLPDIPIVSFFYWPRQLRSTFQDNRGAWIRRATEVLNDI